jgi:membrane protease YdiL (CAAX protease family)
VVAVGVWIGLSVVVGIATFAVGNAVSPEWAADPDNVAIVITTEVYTLLVASILLIAGGGARNRTAIALNRVSARDIATALIALAAVYAVSAIVYLVLEFIASPDPSAVDIVLGIGSDGGRLADAGFWATGLIFVRILILVPLGEELLFRGALFSWIRRRLSAGITIGVTAVLFAVIHGFPIILPAALLFGVAMGWVREQTGSVVPGIVAHSVNGIVLIALSRLTTDWSARLPF